MFTTAATSVNRPVTGSLGSGGATGVAAAGRTSTTAAREAAGAALSGAAVTVSRLAAGATWRTRVDVVSAGRGFEFDWVTEVLELGLAIGLAVAGESDSVAGSASAVTVAGGFGFGSASSVDDVLVAGAEWAGSLVFTGRVDGAEADPRARWTVPDGRVEGSLVDALGPAASFASVLLLLDDGDEDEDAADPAEPVSSA